MAQAKTFFDIIKAFPTDVHQRIAAFLSAIVYKPEIIPQAGTALTTITHTAPTTPDYAIQNLTASSPYGFVTRDEGNTVLSVIANLQARVAAVEGALKASGIMR